ncbi:Phenylacetate-coenzyme A ligase [bioreactor metagenome]|uniref:Phenylacetate-coenzyme A ligase n=1 Tax=bioreactor metagenome TaxID=1076179 RepID=A0A645AHT3_9ZZZZ
MLIVRGVNVFPTQVEEQIMRIAQLSGIYQIHLSREGHMDNVEVHCELQPNVSGQLSASELQQLMKELQHHIKTNVGISTQVKVFESFALPRTLTGKSRRVFDERPKQT